MPTFERARALDLDGVGACVRAGLAGGTATHRLGLELEFLPIERLPVGSRRVPVHAGGGARSSVVDILGGSPPRTVPAGPDGNALLTVEPGGQLEISLPCRDTVDEVLAQSEVVAQDLARRADRHGVVLAAVGIDAWHDVSTVPQQLTAPRYQAMDRYLAARGPAGALMMRHTCALQLNIDLGDAPTVRDERWVVANLLAPVATATFACSPARTGRVRSQRARAWQQLDPTRTGFPHDFLADRGGMHDQVAQAALDADVLLLPTGVDPTSGQLTQAAPGRPGWRFRDWMAAGDPAVGWPTTDDLARHLTTLFHEVRPRGPIEIRSIDALPPAWRPAPIVLYAGALLDDRARGRIREVLAPYRSRLPRLLERAAREGVSDPALCALAVEVWSFALAGAGRLPGLDAAHLQRTETFLERFTLRGRTPGDDLLGLLATNPLAALDAMAEPCHAVRVEEGP